MPKLSAHQSVVARARASRPAGDHAARPAHPIVALQRQVGNAQVARMIATIQPQREPEEDELKAKRDPAIQRQAEEDELATKRDPAIQRQAEEDELATKRDPAIQRAGAGADAPEVGPEGGPISPELSARIQSMRGGGAPLDGQVRERMEGSLGASLAGVRVHTGGEAASISRRIGALAFTTGSDIFFANSSGPADQRLLAHELTHVVQQGGGAPSGGPLSVGAADDSYEREADSVADSVASAPPVSRKQAEAE